MASDDSVSDWFEPLRAGDHAAAQKLWERYFQALVALAHARLRSTRQGARDAEDVALSAFTSFCTAAQRGRLPKLNDRYDLWRLLVTITVRKVQHHLRDEGRMKRRAPVRDKSSSPEAVVDLDKILGREPSPDFAAQVAEQYCRLLDSLDDDQLRSIAVWKMEGHTAQEIAKKLSCVPRTVEAPIEVDSQPMGA